MDGATFPTEPGAFSLDSLTYAQLLTQAVQGMDTGDQHEATQVSVGSVDGMGTGDQQETTQVSVGSVGGWAGATSRRPPR